MTAEYIKDSLFIDYAAKRMTFRVAAANGDYVKFPVKLLSDNVTVSMSPYYDGADFIVPGITKEAVLDREGFTMSKVGIPVNGNKIYLDPRKDAVDVEVHGDIPFPKKVKSHDHELMLL